MKHKKQQTVSDCETTAMNLLKAIRDVGQYRIWCLNFLDDNDFDELINDFEAKLKVNKAKGDFSTWEDIDINKIEYANGYIVKNYNQSLYILTRVGATNSNPFTVIGGEPIFDSMLYVNPTTIKLCKSAYKKLNEAKR